MTYYVWINNSLVGWVIAATEKEALKLAPIKFPDSDFGVYEVKVRR